MSEAAPVPFTESKAPESPERLHKGALGLIDISASTMANIGPAYSFYFGFAGIVLAAGIGLNASIGRPWSLFTVAFGLVGVAALLLRRRAPGPVFGITGVAAFAVVVAGDPIAAKPSCR